MKILTVNYKGGECFSETDLTDLKDIWDMIDRIIPDVKFWVNWDRLSTNCFKFENGVCVNNYEAMNKIYRTEKIFIQGELF